jgi:hypothetical protein
VATVQIGDRSVEIAPFSNFKFIEATELVATILEGMPEITETYSAYLTDYRERRSVTFERAEFTQRFPAEAVGMTDEMWDVTGGKITLPAEPSMLETLAQIGPPLLRGNRDNLIALASLVLVPNSELEDAEALKLYEDDDSPVVRERKHLLHRTTPRTLLQVLALAIDSLKEEFEGQTEALGKIGAFVGMSQPATPAPTGADDEGSEARSSGGRSSSRKQRGSSRGGAAKKSSTASRPANTRRSAAPSKA